MMPIKRISQDLGNGRDPVRHIQSATIEAKILTADEAAGIIDGAIKRLNTVCEIYAEVNAWDEISKLHGDVQRTILQIRISSSDRISRVRFQNWVKKSARGFRIKYET